MTSPAPNLSELLGELVEDARPLTGPEIRQHASSHRRRRVPPWLIVGGAAAACLAIVGAVSLIGRETSTDTTEPGPTATFRWNAQTFSYPAGWYAADFDLQSRGPVALGPYLSSRPLQDPCTRPSPGVRTCGSPVQALAPGDVLAQWRAWGPRDGSITGLPGTSWTHSAGYLAKSETRAAGSDCKALGGSTSIDLFVAATAQTTIFNLNVCVADQAGSFDRDLVREIADSLRVR